MITSRRSPLYPIRSYASELDVRVGDVVRQRHDGELHGGIAPGFPDAIVVEVDGPHSEAKLSRPHARIEAGRVHVLTETYTVKLSWLVDRFYALTRGVSGEIDNRDYGEPAVPGSFGTGASGVAELQPPKARRGLLATLQRDGFAVVTEGTEDPRDVLPRLLSALAELAPDAHRELTAGGSLPTWLPPEAMADQLHPFWASKAADEGLGTLMMALNVAAPADFCFTFEGSYMRLGFFRDSSELG